jgi:hypothetical protein
MIPVSRHKRVDWGRLVENLMRVGMTQQEIADAVGIGFGTLRDYRADENREPAFWAGTKLLMLWSEKVGAPWTDAPLKTVTPSVSEVLRANR